VPKVRVGVDKETFGDPLPNDPPPPQLPNNHNPLTRNEKTFFMVCPRLTKGADCQSSLATEGV
jgi:hypothetical protein